MNSIFKFLLIPSILLIFWPFHPIHAQQKEKDKEAEKGKIEEFEKAVENKTENKKEADEGEPGESPEEEEGLISFVMEDIFGDLLAYALLKAFIGPGSTGDSLTFSEWVWHNSYSDYPYAQESEGLFSESQNKRYSIQFASHYFYNSNRLTGIALRGRLSPWPFLGLEFRFTDLSETLRSRFDHIRFYDVFVNYYRVRHPRWVLWWGVGFKGMQGDRTFNGPALNFGTEIYPKKPLSLHVHFNVGSLNNTGVSETLIQLNWHVKRALFFIGYQRFSARTAILDGFISGVGLHF